MPRRAQKIKQLEHQKGSAVGTTDRAPLSSDGKDGDMLIRPSASGGAFLYAKAQGRWFTFAPVQNQIDGWHGSRNMVKLMPSDIRASAYQWNIEPPVINTFYEYGWLYNARDDNYLTFNVAVPTGFIATSLFIRILTYGSGTNSDPLINVYVTNVITGDETSVIADVDTFNEEIALPPVVANDNTYLAISVRRWSGSVCGQIWHAFQGGFVRIEPVLTPERMAAGLNETTVLDRTSGG